MSIQHSRASSRFRSGGGRAPRRRFWSLLSFWLGVWRERQALSQLSDDDLRDIGLTRADVEREVRRRPWDIDGR